MLFLGIIDLDDHIWVLALLLEDDPESIVKNKVLRFWWVVYQDRSYFNNNHTFVFYFNTGLVYFEFDSFINSRKDIVGEIFILEWYIFNLGYFPSIIQIHHRHLKPIHTFHPLQRLFLPLIDLSNNVSHRGIKIIHPQQVHPLVVFFCLELDQKLVLVLVVQVVDLVAMLLGSGFEAFDGGALKLEVVVCGELYWILEGFGEVGVRDDVLVAQSG